MHATAPPTLQLVRRAPLVVRGRGFRPHERVRVVELAPAGRTVRIRAAAGGGFVVELVAGDRCSAISVVATAPGERAALKAPPPPECPPAGSP